VHTDLTNLLPSLLDGWDERPLVFLAGVPGEEAAQVLADHLVRIGFRLR
jgi:hypothetical protein